jgi:hypothetical protein
VQRSGTDTGTKLRRYGWGTLSFLKTRERTFITSNDLRIARRSADKKTWGSRLQRDGGSPWSEERNCKSSITKVKGCLCLSWQGTPNDFE